MEGEKRLKRQVKKHKWFRLCDVIVFSRASSDSVTREIIRIITATHSAERARAKSKACLAQQRREPLWCSCIDIKKNLTKEFSVKHSPRQEVDLQISQSKFIANTEYRIHEQRKQWEVWVDGVIRDRRPACIDIHSNTDNKLKTTTEQVSAVVTHRLESLWILEPGASLLLMGTFFQTSIKPQTVACGTYRMYMTYLCVPQSLMFIHGSLWSRLKGGCGSPGAVIRPHHRPKETFRNYISDVLALVPGFVFPRHVCACVFLTFSAAVSARAAACRFSWDAMMWQRWHSLRSSSSSGSP